MAAGDSTGEGGAGGVDIVDGGRGVVEVFLKWVEELMWCAIGRLVSLTWRFTYLGWGGRCEAREDEFP